MSLQKEADRLMESLQAVGVERISFEHCERIPEGVTSLVFLSTVGPFNPVLFEGGQFSDIKRRIDGYLKIHSKLASENVPSVLVVRDDFARGFRLKNHGSFASESNVAELVNLITQYAVAFITRDSGKTPSTANFRVVRESAYSQRNSVEFLRALGSVDLSTLSKHFAALDIQTGLDLVLVVLGDSRERPSPKKHIEMIASSLFGSRHQAVLIEWSGMVKRFKDAGLYLDLPIAEVTTFKGQEGTREFYEAGLELLVKQ